MIIAEVQRPSIVFDAMLLGGGVVTFSPRDVCAGDWVRLVEAGDESSPRRVEYLEVERGLGTRRAGMASHPRRVRCVGAVVRPIQWPAAPAAVEIPSPPVRAIAEGTGT